MEEITKYGILMDELTAAEAKADSLRRLLDGLTNTPCHASACSCGLEFETEADFAQHFVVARINRINRHLNLGECPFSAKGEAIIAAGL